MTPVAGLATQRLLGGCTDSSVILLGQADAATPAHADAGRASEANAAAVDVAWASGGTSAMKGGYPDPFETDPGVACVLTKAMILGPCYADTLEREDISEGMPGVPMRLSLQVLRADGCSPVAGATVDIWHAKAEGVYSAFDPNTACNPGTTELKEERFCRGVQTTDDAGKVNFSTIVPGWYPGRAVHVHFTVRVDGEEYLTSQLFFDDPLLDEIEQQVDYVDRGTRDTRNDSDGVLPADEQTPFMLSTAKRADGALHAWKVLLLRSSLDEELPSASGAFSPPADFDGGVPEGLPGDFPGAPPMP